jgi:TM2 domain-containing membrane protein YozV
MAENQAAAAPASPGRVWPAVVAGWLVPGAGHLYLRRPGRAAIFCALVVAALAIGCALDGNLYGAISGQPLTVLATVASMGAGLPYFAVRHGLAYRGDPVSWGYEYGTAFLLTAGLMNLLVVFDAWDIAQGHKE